MPGKDPFKVAQKWKRNVQAATVDIQEGVQRVTESPAQKAIAKKDKMRQNILASIDDGSWEKGLSKVTLEDWREAMIKKGIPRMAQGAESGAPKMEAYMSKALPYMDALSARIAAMPDLNLTDSIARATAWITGMAEFKKG